MFLLVRRFLCVFGGEIGTDGWSQEELSQLPSSQLGGVMVEKGGLKGAVPGLSADRTRSKKSAHPAKLGGLPPKAELPGLPRGTPPKIHRPSGAASRSLCRNPAQRCPRCEVARRNPAQRFPRCEMACRNPAQRFPKCEVARRNPAQRFPRCEMACRNPAQRFPKCEMACRNPAQGIRGSRTACRNPARGIRGCRPPRRNPARHPAGRGRAVGKAASRSWAQCPTVCGAVEETGVSLPGGGKSRAPFT